MMTNKINAVEMVRQIRDQQYDQTNTMDNAEKQAYYQHKAQSLIARLQSRIRAWRKRLVAA